MSVPVDTWETGAPPPRPARGRRSVAVLLVTLLAVVTLAAGGIVWVLVLSRPAGVVRAGLASRHALYPDEWDPRAAELVAFVERERGLRFKHPVRIDFLDDAAFEKEVTDEEVLDEQEQASLESDQAMLRALGLLTGDVDLVAASNTLVADGVAGAYSTEDERILVRGDDLDDELRLTLVHELTHALQDQHFDIGGYEDEEHTSGELAAYTALVEADASDVEDAWRETLPAAAQDALDAAEEKGDAPGAFEGVPQVFVELMAFPYEFGPDFLQAVVEKEGSRGRNRLFADPPISEEHILLPETYLSRQEPQHVDLPALVDGETLVEDSEDDMGMLSLLVMLAERIDFGVAWPAVQGWAGDAIVAFERAGTTCVRAEVAFDEGARAERFDRALAEWSKGRPTTHSRNDRMVRFESCDPGAAAGGGRKEGHVSGIQGLGLRQATISSLQGQGAPEKAATCVVDGLLEQLGANRLAQLDAAIAANPQDPGVLEIQRNVARLAPGCR